MKKNNICQLHLSASGKLALRAETIRQLTTRQLNHVAGGAPRPTSAISCIETVCKPPPDTDYCSDGCE